MYGKPPVSGCPSQKDLCQCWIVHFTKHSSTYASRNKAHVSPISFSNWTQKLIAAHCLEHYVYFFLCFTHQSTHTWIYRDYCHRYTHRTQCRPVSFERYIFPCTPMCFQMPPFLWCIHLNVSLLVGVGQHALTKLTIPRRLFRIVSWFRTLSTCIELQNTIVYGSSPIEHTGGTWERCTKTYGTTFVY